MAKQSNQHRPNVDEIVDQGRLTMTSSSKPLLDSLVKAHDTWGHVILPPYSPEASKEIAPKKRSPGSKMYRITSGCVGRFSCRNSFNWSCTTKCVQGKKRQRCFFSTKSYSFGCHVAEAGSGHGTPPLRNMWCQQVSVRATTGGAEETKFIRLQISERTTLIFA